MMNSGNLKIFGNITAIPRYILLDAKGNLVNSDAPRPGDPGLKEALNQLLGNAAGR